MRNTKKITICIATCLFLVASLSGCGKEKADSVEDKTTEISENDSVTGKTESSEYEMSVVEYVVPTEWEEDISNTETNAKIRINTTIDAANSHNMKVINIANKTYDETAKEELINSLSEGTVYKYDLEFYTKDMLEPVIKDLEDRIERLEANGVFEGNAELKNELDIALDEYNTLYDNASDSLTVAEDYKCDRYLVSYDNKDYILDFCEYGESFLFESHDYSGISFEITNLSAYTKVSDIEYEEVDFSQEVYVGSNDVEVDNICSMTEGEAVAVADDFINNMGFGEFAVTAQYPTYVYGSYSDGGNYFQDDWYDGYTFVFERVIDDVPLDIKRYHSSKFIEYQVYEYMEDEGYNINEYSWSGNFDAECIYVSVNDSGVVEFSYHYPLEMGDVMAENIELLSFDKIQASVENYLATASYYTYSFYNLNECKLTYFPIRDKENSELKALVPVWAMINPEGDAFLLINAIDGSIVNVGVNMLNPTFYEWEE